MPNYNLSLNQQEFDYLLDLVQNAHSSVCSASKHRDLWKKSPELRLSYRLSFELLLKFQDLYGKEEN